MPKKGGQEPSKKAIQKEKEKIIQDKTFGLKNKNKSKKVQQYMKNVQARVQNVDKRAVEEQKKKKEEKAAAKAAEKEIQSLFKPAIVQPKVPPGVDPKSFVCEFFKAGQCTKGDKCKFSHNLDVARRSEKIDLYTDRRDVTDSMDTWDQTELERVVSMKQDEVNKNLPTKIVCKYFIEAVEQRKYGWFWECPNGPSCQYVHALPPGFVLKKKEEPKEEVDENDQETIENEIEAERIKLRPGGEPVTKESFERWKKEKEKQKADAVKKKDEQRKSEIEAGRVLMSGRELLVYNPNVFVDDEDSLVSTELIKDDEAFDQEQTLALQRELNAAAAEMGVTEKELYDPSAASGYTTVSSTAPSQLTVEYSATSQSTNTTQPLASEETLPGALDESLFLDDEDTEAPTEEPEVESTPAPEPAPAPASVSTTGN